MATLKVLDADGSVQYMQAASGAGTSGDPFVLGSDFIADETNIVIEYLTNGGSNEMDVDGSSTAVTFSSTVVPTGKVLIIARMLGYMESATAMDSQAFGDLTALTNGIQFKVNGTDIINYKKNEELAISMFDAHGVKNLGKEDRTMLGRFSFNKITDGAEGLYVREGQYFQMVVQDNLTGLDHLHVQIQGVLKDA